jgi:hypothetical protein
MSNWINFGTVLNKHNGFYKNWNVEQDGHHEEILMDIDISDIIPMFTCNINKLNTLISAVKNSEPMKPITLGISDNGKYYIIDGVHRINVFNMLSYKKIKAWVDVFEGASDSSDGES